MVVAGLAWLVSARLHDGYVSALAASLESGAIALGDDDAADLTTRKTLADTTALLDREKLLARIEQLQKTKESTAKSATSTTSLSGADAPDTAGEPLTAASDLAADLLVARAAQLLSGDTARTCALRFPVPVAWRLALRAVPNGTRCQSAKVLRHTN